MANLNATGTIALRDGLNISSLTDHGTGYHEVSFTAAFNDTNFSIAFGSGDHGASFGVVMPFVANDVAPTVNNVRIRAQNSGGTSNDLARLMAHFHGDLA